MKALREYFSEPIESTGERGKIHIYLNLAHRAHTKQKSIFDVKLQELPDLERGGTRTGAGAGSGALGKKQVNTLCLTKVSPCHACGPVPVCRACQIFCNEAIVLDAIRSDVAEYLGSRRIDHFGDTGMDCQTGGSACATS